MSTVGIIVVVAVLLMATTVGLVARVRAGRVRRTGGTAVDGWALAGTVPAAADRVLLLQLSSPVCAPCRQTYRLLDDLAGGDPGVRHVEVDVADRPDVARSLAVMRTPTTVGFDRGGREVLRITGVPRRAELTAALDAVGRV